MMAILFADFLLIAFPFFLMPAMLLFIFLSFRRSILVMSEALTKDDFLEMAKVLYDLRVRQSRNPLTKKPIVDTPNPEEDGTEFFNYFHYHIATSAIERSSTNKWAGLLATATMAAMAILLLFFSIYDLMKDGGALGSIALVCCGVLLLGFSICFMTLPGRNNDLIKEADEKLTLLFQEFKNGQAQSAPSIIDQKDNN